MTQRLYGLHTVRSRLIHNQAISQLWVLATRRDQAMQTVIELAAEKNIPIEYLAREQLDALVAGANHQGVVAECQHERAVFLPLESLLAELKHPAMLLILDQIQDPHNLGACLRTADGAGVDAVIAPKDHSVGLTAAVCKVACGAAETVPFYPVTNLARTLAMIKAFGIWVYGFAAEASRSLYEVDVSGPVAFVMGAEGHGLRRLSAKSCDELLSIPMSGSVNSLNVSVASAIALYETVRQRRMNKK